MRTPIVLALLLLCSVAQAQIFPLAPDAPAGGGVTSGGTVAAGELKLNDDINLTLGTDNDFRLRFDSAANRLELFGASDIFSVTSGGVFELNNVLRLNGGYFATSAGDVADLGAIRMLNVDQIRWEGTTEPSIGVNTAGDRFLFSLAGSTAAIQFRRSGSLSEMYLDPSAETGLEGGATSLSAQVSGANKIIMTTATGVDVGANCTSTHSQSTSDVCMPAQLEVDGLFFADAAATFASTARAASGSTSAPSFAFTASIDSGIYSPGVNQIAMVSGGNEFLHSLGGNGISAPLGVAVGTGGSKITLTRSAGASIDFGATAAGTCDTGAATLTMSGADEGEPVYLGISNTLATADANQSFWGWVSGSDTVSVKRCCHNLTIACSDPAAATVRAVFLDF